VAIIDAALIDAKLVGLIKMGNKYLRKLLIVGMTSLARRAKYNLETVDPQLAYLLARKPVRAATLVMANKAARVVWAIKTRGETYRSEHVMANRSDRKQGQPRKCPRRHSLKCRMGPCSRTPSGPAVQNRLHQHAEQKTAPDQCHCIILPLQRGSHPQVVLVLRAALRSFRSLDFLACVPEGGRWLTEKLF
jgi:hypothetical protein